MKVGERVIPYLDAQAWTVASIPRRSSRAVTVFATGSDTWGGGACGPAVGRLRAYETASTVRILVSDYQQSSSAGLACPAIGYLPSAQPVRLKAPLGHRRLLDDSTGKAAALLVGSDYPDLITPPGSPSRSVLQRMHGDSGPVERYWSYTDGRQLVLQIRRPADLRSISPYGRTVQQLEIHRTPATVYSAGGKKYGVQQVVWTPNPKQTLSLILSNSPKRLWSTAEAVTAARAVSNYRTVFSDRLPQPSSPGTAAAVYNSADGPVKHAENLFKSSGVYIALDCQGRGHVTVTFRDTDYLFPCTSTLSHRVRKSIGSPNDAFFVDITADPGVRWAATLARASLDGS